jgi:hypothetical protein
MTNADSKDGDRYLSDADLQMIEARIPSLPGRWYLDPLIDRRRAGRPRAWVRADELAVHRVIAIGLERSIGCVFVTVCRNGEDEREALPAKVYRTLEGALASLPMWLNFQADIDNICGANPPASLGSEC